LFGSKNSQIATLVERQTRYVMLVRVGGKDSQTVINALIKSARRLPQELYKSLTWDRGVEMAGHKRFTFATDIKVYFCDPILGNAGPMRIRTGYCANTFPREWTFPPSRKPSSML
jgi:IS30 family transposase